MIPRIFCRAAHRLFTKKTVIAASARQSCHSDCFLHHDGMSNSKAIARHCAEFNYDSVRKVTRRSFATLPSQTPSLSDSSSDPAERGSNVYDVYDNHIPQKNLKTENSKDKATKLEQEIVVYFHTCIFNGDVEQANCVSFL